MLGSTDSSRNAEISYLDLLVARITYICTLAYNVRDFKFRTKYNKFHQRITVL